MYTTFESTFRKVDSFLGRQLGSIAAGSGDEGSAKSLAEPHLRARKEMGKEGR